MLAWPICHEVSPGCNALTRDANVVNRRRTMVCQISFKLAEDREDDQIACLTYLSGSLSIGRASEIAQLDFSFG